MKTFTAGPDDAGVRLSRYVQRVTHGLPDSLLYKSFRNRRIKVNGKRAAAEYRILQGDVIDLYINDEFFSPQPEAKPAVNRETLRIVYEDARIAVLFKPEHLLCHSDRTLDTNLVDQFQAYLSEKGEWAPAGGSPFRPSLCNRLDRGTEGLVLAAKTHDALRDGTILIRDGLVTKKYLCITAGQPPAGIQKAWLYKDEAKNRVTVYRKQTENRREIITGIEILQTKGGFSLCEITLYTGRTHQIRAHLAFLGCPLLGDRKYGDEELNARYPQFADQALCAWKLAFSPQIPGTSTLQYLAGHSFSLDDCSVLRSFSRL